MVGPQAGQSVRPSRRTRHSAPPHGHRTPQGLRADRRERLCPGRRGRGRHLHGRQRAARRDHRVTVSGAVRLGGGVRSNGCLSIGGSGTAVSVDRRVPGQTMATFTSTGRRSPGGGSGARRALRCTTDFTPQSPDGCDFDLWDPLARDDNSGEPEGEGAAPHADPHAHRAVGRATAPAAHRVAAARPVRVNLVLQDRHAVHDQAPWQVQAQIIVRGRYTSTGVSADASCVRTPPVDRPVPDVVDQDPLNVWSTTSRSGGALGPGDGAPRSTATRPGSLRPGTAGPGERLRPRPPGQQGRPRGHRAPRAEMCGGRSLPAQPRAAISEGRMNSMPSDQVTWVSIGASTPPLTLRCRPTSTPSTAAAKTSITLPVATVIRA